MYHAKVTRRKHCDQLCASSSMSVSESKLCSALPCHHTLVSGLMPSAHAAPCVALASARLYHISNVHGMHTTRKMRSTQMLLRPISRLLDCCRRSPELFSRCENWLRHTGAIWRAIVRVMPSMRKPVDLNRSGAQRSITQPSSILAYTAAPEIRTRSWVAAFEDGQVAQLAIKRVALVGSAPQPLRLITPSPYPSLLSESISAQFCSRRAC